MLKSVIVIAVAVLTITGPADAQREADVVRTIDGDAVYKLLPPDRIPAIRDPEFVTGTEADRQMLPHEPVLGVVIGEEAHAYSLWQLDAHEIVNDEIAGKAIAATW
jgi:hypothetical protein